MKSKLVILAAAALLAAGSAQAINNGDGNIFDVINAVPDSYDNLAYFFTLLTVTTLNATAVIDHADNPSGDYNFVQLYKITDNGFTSQFIEQFSVTTTLAMHKFENLTAGEYAYNVSTYNSGATTEELTFTSSAVPEPGTYAMLLAGFVILGVATRRHMRTN